MIRESRGSAVASLVLCSLLWSSGGLLIKLVDWDPLAIAGARSAIGLATMILILGLPRFTFGVDQVMVALSYSATMILFVVANKMTTSANAVLLQYTEPVYIILLGRRFLPDEKTGLSDWLCVAGILFGMVLFFFDDLSLSANAGNLLAVLSGITFALTAVFMRRQKAGRPADSLMLAHVLTLAVSAPFMFRAGLPSPASLGGLALLGLFQMGIPSVLYGRGIRGVSAVGAAVITMLEPALNPIWVALIVGEIPSSRAVAGGCIILLCVTARTVLKAEKM